MGVKFCAREATPIMDTYNIVLMQPPGYVHSLAFQDVGNLLLHSFRSLGLHAEVRSNAFEPWSMNIVLGYHLLTDTSIFDRCRCIPYQLEQLSEQDGWLTPQQPILLQKSFEIWDFSPRNITFMADRGMTRTRLVPLGFHEQCRTIIKSQEDIDVLFYGSLTPRRRAVIEALAKHCTVKALFGIYGAERDSYIARSRIILNMHQFAAQLMEEVRLSYLLNNHCFIVSEDSPANPYEGAIVTAPYDRLVDSCLRYLSDPAERGRIAEAGFNQFRQRPMAEHLKKVLGPQSLPGDKVTGRQGDKVTERQGDKARGSQTDKANESDAVSSCHPVTLSPCLPVTLSPCLPVSQSPCLGVSLCLIVKNEEANLPVCLNSVAGLVDEIVITDTGSTDRTKEVAARFGARVNDFPWVDDFAAARNAGLEQARGQWIFWLDADDYLDAENRRKLQELFAALPDENVAYSMKYASLTGPAGAGVQIAERLHLFRNRPDIRWRNRVHEQIGPAILESGGTLRPTDIVVWHGGYVDPVHRMRKEERNLRLSRMEVAEQPNDPAVLFHLGRGLLNMNRPAEALPVLQRGLECADPATTMARKMYLQVTRARSNWDS